MAPDRNPKRQRAKHLRDFTRLHFGLLLPRHSSKVALSSYNLSPYINAKFQKGRFAKMIRCIPLYLLVLLVIQTPGLAQDKSVRPGINDTFRDPNVSEFQGRFEVESREVYAARQKIIDACQLKSGTVIGDVGAGTGLFTRLFVRAIGADGHVIAVDISQKFLDHVQSTCREAGYKNVQTLLCKADSTELPVESIDLAFICDTYHHFEFPLKTMASIHRALKPNGRVIVVDFKRIEGESSDWTLNHVRAGQEVVEAEIVQSGFKKSGERKDLLKENYFLEFTKSSNVP